MTYTVIYRSGTKIKSATFISYLDMMRFTQDVKITIIEIL